jgi:hypothetical protein
LNRREYFFFYRKSSKKGYNPNKGGASGTVRENKELCLMGQAISGEGFFYLDFDEGGDEETEASNAAVLSFDGLPLSARDLEAELHHLIGFDWDWKVTQVAAKEFTVIFP